MNMTLMPTNLLHLCDDIQEKIGKEIKYIRVQKDAKKRRDFITNCMQDALGPPLRLDLVLPSFIIKHVNVCLYKTIRNNVCENYKNYIKDKKVLSNKKSKSSLKQIFMGNNIDMFKFYLNYNTEKSKIAIGKI